MGSEMCIRDSINKNNPTVSWGYFLTSNYMKKIIFALLLVFTTTVSSQITFTSIPSEKQLFGRDLNTNYGQVDISGYINIGDNYDLDFSNWSAGEPNNTPAPEDYAEIVNSYGMWNDANGSEGKKSYIEYEGLIPVSYTHLTLPTKA